MIFSTTYCEYLLLFTIKMKNFREKYKVVFNSTHSDIRYIMPIHKLLIVGCNGRRNSIQISSNRSYLINMREIA